MQDAQLDAQRERLDTEVLAGSSLLGCFAPVVAAVCASPALLSVHPALRASALLALSKLMAVDAAFCEQNMQLMFTMLANE